MNAKAKKEYTNCVFFFYCLESWIEPTSLRAALRTQGTEQRPPPAAEEGSAEGCAATQWNEPSLYGEIELLVANGRGSSPTRGAKVLEINCFKDFFFLPITNQLI